MLINYKFSGANKKGYPKYILSSTQRIYANWFVNRGEIYHEGAGWQYKTSWFLTATNLATSLKPRELNILVSYIFWIDDKHVSVKLLNKYGIFIFFIVFDYFSRLEKVKKTRKIFAILFRDWTVPYLLFYIFVCKPNIGI